MVARWVTTHRVGNGRGDVPIADDGPSAYLTESDSIAKVDINCRMSDWLQPTTGFCGSSAFNLPRGTSDLVMLSEHHARVLITLTQEMTTLEGQRAETDRVLTEGHVARNRSDTERFNAEARALELRLQLQDSTATPPGDVTDHPPVGCPRHSTESRCSNIDFVVRLALDNVPIVYVNALGIRHRDRMLGDIRGQYQTCEGATAAPSETAASSSTAPTAAVFLRQPGGPPPKLLPPRNRRLTFNGCARWPVRARVCSRTAHIVDRFRLRV